MCKKTVILCLICMLLVIGLAFYHMKNSSMYSWETVDALSFPNEEMIAVATYNIQFGRGQDGRVDLQRTIDTLKMLNADIICLQEVERFSLRSNFEDQISIIANALGMEAVFYPTLSYPGLYYGNAILSKYPIQDTKIVMFPSKLENRSALYSQIQLTDDDIIYVVNTHLGLNRKERETAIEHIYESLLTLEYPILLMGDLNSTPYQKEYDRWEEVLTKSNINKSLYTYYKHQWQIDYIFHTTEFIVEDVFVFEADSSDHYPLYTLFSLPILNK